MTSGWCSDWQRPSSHVLKEACGNQPNDPVARLTNLGWVCIGPTLVEEFCRNSRSHFTRTYQSSQVNKPPPPDDILHAFWEVEPLAIRDTTEQTMTAEERAAVQWVAETLKCNDGWYKIGVPWKEGVLKLTSNYEVEFDKLTSQEKSLRRKGPEVMKAYSKIFETMRKRITYRRYPSQKLRSSSFCHTFQWSEKIELQRRSVSSLTL